MTTDKEGNRFEGFWRNGKRNGIGKAIQVTGQTHLERYRNGKLI